jgi:diguanylate cyclase (GGDEF)-like protein
MIKLLKDIKPHIKIRWLTRVTGLVSLAIFLSFFMPSTVNESLNVVTTVFILLMVVIYLVAVLSFFNNNLLNAILIVFTVLVLNFFIHLAYPILNLLIIHILYIPGFLALGCYLFNHKSYISINNQITELEQKYKISLKMMEITPHIIQSTDLNQILQMILEKAVEIMPKAQMGSILIRHGDVMKFHAAVGYDMDILNQIEIRLDEMFQYKLGILHEPSIMKDIKTFNKENMQFKKYQTLEEGKATVAKAILTAPIRVEGKIYGFINLDNIEDHNAFDDKDKLYINHLATLIDIAINNHLLVENIYKLSRYDKLTETYSRQYNWELMQNALEHATKHHEIFTVCVIDMNDLKKVNDKYGHEAGDRYLRHFTYIIKKHITEDIIFSRTGGDEFIMTIPRTTPLEASKMIDKIRSTFAKTPFHYGKLDINVTFGCGFAVYPKDAKEINKLIEIADKHMYSDKTSQKQNL